MVLCLWPKSIHICYTMRHISCLIVACIVLLKTVKTTSCIHAVQQCAVSRKQYITVVQYSNVPLILQLWWFLSVCNCKLLITIEHMCQIQGLRYNYLWPTRLYLMSYINGLCAGRLYCAHATDTASPRIHCNSWAANQDLQAPAPPPCYGHFVSLRFCPGLFQCPGSGEELSVDEKRKRRKPWITFRVAGQAGSSLLCFQVCILPMCWTLGTEFRRRVANFVVWKCKFEYDCLRCTVPTVHSWNDAPAQPTSR